MSFDQNRNVNDLLAGEMTHGAPAKKSTNDDEEVIPPPDGGWGWAVVFGSFMIHVIGKIKTNKPPKK